MDINTGKHLLQRLTTEAERMHRLCQHHNIADAMPEMTDLITKIKDTCQQSVITIPEMLEIQIKYAKCRAAIREPMLNDMDIYKSADRTACLIDDALWMLMNSFTKMERVIQNMSKAKHAGYDEYTGPIAIGMYIYGRRDMLMNVLKNQQAIILNNPDENTAKDIAGQARTLVQELVEFKTVLDTYQPPDEI